MTDKPKEETKYYLVFFKQDKSDEDNREVYAAYNCVRYPVIGDIVKITHELSEKHPDIANDCIDIIERELFEELIKETK
jgi:hypothetical protein